MPHFQHRPLSDGKVLVVVSEQPVSLEHVTQAFIATAEQFEKAKETNEVEQFKSNVIDIGEWKKGHSEIASG